MTVKSSNSVSPLIEDEEVEKGVKKKWRNSKKICVLFRITQGLEFPHFAIIVTNLVLSVPVLLLIFAYFARALMVDLEEKPEPVIRYIFKTGNGTEQQQPSDSYEQTPTPMDYGFPAKLYCVSYLTWSLFTELISQFVYTAGSVLLLVGALKRIKRLCYSFVVCGIFAFFLAAVIRTGQFALCDKNQLTNVKGRSHSYLPAHFKLIFIWLVCQLFWYWLVLSLVAALLNWMHAEETDDSDRKTPTPSTSTCSSSATTVKPAPPPQECDAQPEAEDEKEKEEKAEEEENENPEDEKKKEKEKEEKE